MAKLERESGTNDPFPATFPLETLRKEIKLLDLREREQNLGERDKQPKQNRQRQTSSFERSLGKILEERDEQPKKCRERVKSLTCRDTHKVSNCSWCLVKRGFIKAKARGEGDN